MKLRLPTKPLTRRLAIGGMAIAVAGLGYLGVTLYTLWRADTAVERIENAFPTGSSRPTQSEEDTGVNILLLGVDTRASAGTNLAEVTGRRADSMVLVHVSADYKHLTMISIMRDTWIVIPGVGTNKINAALSLGSMSVLVETIEGLIDSRIDRVAMVDFNGFADIVDELGGVTLQNDRAFSYSIKPYYEFPVGELTLEGKELLAFSRERKNLPGSDYQRVENQRKVLLAIFEKFQKSGMIGDPLKLASMYETLSQYLALDEGFTLRYVIGLANRIADLDADGINTFTLPTMGGGRSPDGQSVVYIDNVQLQVVRKLLDDDLIHTYEVPED